MTLLEILARELPKWPKDAECIAQDADQTVWGWGVDGLEFYEGCWDHASGLGILDEVFGMRKTVDLADDHATAVVTEKQWLEARQ